MIARTFTVLFFWLGISWIPSAIGQDTGSQWVTGSQPNQPLVRTSVAPVSVRVAEPFVLTIEVEVDAATQVAFDEPPKNFGMLSVLDVQDEMDLPAAKSPNRRLFIRRLTLDSLKSGEVSIPPMAVAISSADRSMALSSDPVSVNVVSELSIDADQPAVLRDVQPTIQLDSNRQSSILSMRNLSILLVVVAGMVIAGLVFLRSRRTTKVSHFEMAKERLARLASNLNTQSNASATFQHIDETLKKLIELETPIAATKLSNEELLDRLEKHFPGGENLPLLQQILQSSQRARFAKVKMELLELEQATEQATQWIDAFFKFRQKELS